MSTAFCINVALGPRVQPDSTLGPLSSHTLLGQLQLEGGTAPLIDSHILQRPKFPQLPGWCGEMRREGRDASSSSEQGSGARPPLSTLHPPPPSTQSEVLTIEVQAG